MSLSSIDRLSRLFGALAGNLWIPNYMGYGKSTGTASEKGCYHTADAVYEYLTRDLKTPAKNIVAMGWSLGAAAIEMASSHSVAGVIALSPFTSIEGIARKPGKPTAPRLSYWPWPRRVTMIFSRLPTGNSGGESGLLSRRLPRDASGRG